MALKEKIDKIEGRSKDNISKIYSIRIPQKYKLILEKHFKENGLSFSTGVRMVLMQYLKKKSILL